MIVLEIQLTVMIILTFSVNLCIMLINRYIIPVKDQNMDTEAIVVPIVATEIVVFQISLNSSQAQIQKTMISGGRKQIRWTSQEKLPVV